MLLKELQDVLTVEQYQAFLKYAAQLPAGKMQITLPDGRKIDWYHEHDLNNFLEACEIVGEEVLATTLVEPEVAGGPCKEA